MIIKQISVFVENKLGKLAEIMNALHKNDINIRALSIADTKDFGILRLIVNDPEKAEAVLKESDYAVSITRVIAIVVEDRPGALAKAMNILTENGISVEYMYAFITRSENEAYVVIRVEDNQKAVDVLTGRGIRILKSEEAYNF